MKWECTNQISQRARRSGSVSTRGIMEQVKLTARRSWVQSPDWTWDLFVWSLRAVSHVGVDFLWVLWFPHSPKALTIS